MISKKGRSIIAGVVLPVMVAVTFTGCNKKPAMIETKLVRKVKTQTIDELSHREKVSVSGNIVPTEIVKVSYKLAGVISNVYPKEGDMIAKGDVISNLDSSDYQIQVSAAQADQSIAEAGIAASQAQLAAAEEEYESAKLQVDKEIPSKINQAKAQLDLTQTSYDRLKTLYEAGAIPESQMDEITTKLNVDTETYQQAQDAREVADAKLRASQKKLEALGSQIGIASAQSAKAGAGIEHANLQISDTTIHSPISGIVLKKIMSAGETTSAGYPVVAIGAIDKVWVEIGVSDQYINRIKKGDTATIEVYGIGENLEGVIDEIGAVADEKTRTFTVKVLVDNPDRTLKPGMIAKTTINLDNDNITLVPLASIIHLNEGACVYIYNDESRTVSQRPVTTGVIIGNQIEVLEGLDKGETIVTEGQFVLRDGDEVTVDEEAAQ